MQGFLQAIRHVALAALILRAMLPAGWMPDAGGLTICSATLGTIHSDPAPGHDQNNSEKAKAGECAFAAAAPFAAAPQAPVIALPALHAFAASIDAAHAAVIAARFSPGAARAPPLNA